MDTINGASGIIPDEQRAVLGAKLEEYQQRSADESRSEDSRVDARHKLAVLSRRLNGDEVDVEAIRQELGDQFYGHYFENAVGVIDDYIATGGANVYGGTGLPSV